MANYEIVALVEGTPQLRAPTASDTGVVTNLAVTTNLTATAGTANGVVYLNGSKVQTSGAGLTFDGTLLQSLTGGGSAAFRVKTTGTGGAHQALMNVYNSANAGLNIGTVSTGWSAGAGLSPNESYIWTTTAAALSFGTNGAESMRLNSTGLAVTGAISATTTIRPGGYTVATLPAGTIGMKAYVTDALAPAFLTLLVGGGAAYSGAQFNGTIWVGD